MIYFIHLLLVHSFLFIVVKAENTTYSNTFDEDTTEKTDRLKHTPYHTYIPPPILNGLIIDEDDVMYIKWQQVTRHLVNENVPVYTAHLNPWGPTHFKRPQIMKNIGKLIIYHSTTHKSVLIYFENHDRFYGIVDKRYYIAGASLDQLLQLKVDGTLVKRFSPVIHTFRESSHPLSDSIMRRVTEIRILNQQAKKSKLNNDSEMVFKTFYIEILVFITYDIYKYMNSKGNTLQNIIFKYLIHFYAADMLFAQFPTKEFEIYLNLAGFIIEVDDGAFSEVTENLNLRYNNGEMIDADYLIERFKRYPNYEDFPFTKDSYDLIYLSTGRSLETKFGRVPSLHSSVRDIFWERMKHGRSFVPMAVVQTLNTYDKYVVSVHEIARSVAIYNVDPMRRGLTVDHQQCYGIMQHARVHCSECITWSDESVYQLKSFLSFNKNRCFLINKPRSLLTPGTPLQSLSPCTQCHCFGYGCYSEGNSKYCPLRIPVTKCDDLLSCKEKLSSKLELTIMPLDGTPCDSNKVCWNEKCVNLPTSPDSK